MAPAGAVAHWLLTTQLRLSRLHGVPGMLNSFEVLECASCQLGFFSCYPQRCADALRRRPLQSSNRVLLCGRGRSNSSLYCSYADSLGGVPELELFIYSTGYLQTLVSKDINRTEGVGAWAWVAPVFVATCGTPFSDYKIFVTIHLEVAYASLLDPVARTFEAARTSMRALEWSLTLEGKCPKGANPRNVQGIYFLLTVGITFQLQREGCQVSVQGPTGSVWARDVTYR